MKWNGTREIIKINSLKFRSGGIDEIQPSIAAHRETLVPKKILGTFTQCFEELGQISGTAVQTMYYNTVTLQGKDENVDKM